MRFCRNFHKHGVLLGVSSIDTASGIKAINSVEIVNVLLCVFLAPPASSMRCQLVPHMHVRAFVYICHDEGPNLPEVSQIYTSAKCALLGLNRRHTVYKTVALTAELRA